MRRNTLVAVSLICMAILTGCLPAFLRPSYNNLAENLSFDPDPAFGIESSQDQNPDKTGEEIYKAINVVHLELVTDLSRDAGCAAGFVVKYGDQPYVLTAGHINATNVKFKAIYAYFSQDQKKPEEVEIVVADSFLDFALLRFKNPKFVYNGPYARLGSSKDLLVGQKVYALGSPLGFRYHMSDGIVGKIEQGMDHDGIYQPEIIMHGATINPGNSGGPLVDSRGRVVGINVMGINGGLSPFRPSVVTTMPAAIPIDDVKMVLRRVKTGGAVRHSYLGLKLWDTRDLSPLDYEQREIPVPDFDGLIVFGIVPGSPADKAGLQKGDMVLMCDGKKYDRTSCIAEHVCFETEPGSEIELKVIRMYKAEQVADSDRDHQVVYRTVYQKLDSKDMLTIKVKPEIR